MCCAMESVAAVWPLQTEDREIEDVRAVQHVQQQARGQRRPRWRRRVARARTDLWLRVLCLRGHQATWGRGSLWSCAIGRV